MDRSDWMSDAGYESGLVAEDRLLKGAVSEERLHQARRTALGAVVAIVGMALAAVVGFLLWPNLMRFGVRMGGHYQPGSPEDWPAVWAMVGAVLVVAALVVALTRSSVTLQSLCEYWANMASYLSTGRKQLPPGRADRQNAWPGVGG